MADLRATMWERGRAMDLFNIPGFHLEARQGDHVSAEPLRKRPRTYTRQHCACGGMRQPRTLRRSGAAVRRSTNSRIRPTLGPKEHTCPQNERLL